MDDFDVERHTGMFLHFTWLREVLRDGDRREI